MAQHCMLPALGRDGATHGGEGGLCRKGVSAKPGASGRAVEAPLLCAATEAASTELGAADPLRARQAEHELALQQARCRSPPGLAAS